MEARERQRLARTADHLAGQAREFFQRFQAEIEFAEGIMHAVGDEARDWPGLIDQAWDIVAEPIHAGQLDRLPAAVHQAEQLLHPVGRTAKTFTIHCVGHGHIDMNWQWSWPETVSTTIDTFTTVLRLMEEFPAFCYTQSQISVYEICRQYAPEIFQQVRDRVAEGRWEVAAAHWVEGDKNLVSGESIARHLLYARRFCAEHFGLTPETQPLDWEPDTFGHAATIPSLVSRAGVRRYYCCRPGPAHRRTPVFWWEGPDGRRVLVNVEHTWYNDFIGPHNARALASFTRATGMTDWMNVFGVGDHGGGPTRQDLLRIEEMNSWPIFPNWRFGTTRRHFETLEMHGDKWPVVRGELNFEFPGCYTSQSRIKQTNRLGEHYCQQAETAAVLGMRSAGTDYPGEQLRQAWIDTCFGHFHDILPGSGVRETREYHMGQFQKVAATTGAIQTRSLRALAGQVDTSFASISQSPDGGSPRPGRAMGAGAGRGSAWTGMSQAAHVGEGPRPMMIFNPTAWERRDVVRLTVWDAGEERQSMAHKRYVLRLPDGARVPTQRVSHGRYWGHNYVELEVPVTVPSLGYVVGVVEEVGAVLPRPSEGYFERVVGEDVAAMETGRLEKTGEWTVENEHVRVRFDPISGGIVELTDRETGAQLATPDHPMAVLEYAVERPGRMSAWRKYPPRRRVSPLEAGEVKWTQTGPHRATLSVRGELAESSFELLYTLKAGSPAVEVEIRVDWQQRGGPELGTPSLNLLLPLAIDDARAWYEIPAGSMCRDQHEGEEVPALRWADVVGTPARDAEAGDRLPAVGCALLNDSKHGHSLDGGDLRVSLLRSSYEPDPLPEMGQHVMRLAICPHGRVLTASELTRMGAELNQPLVIVNTDIHEGPLPANGRPAVTVHPDNVLLTALKKAEDDDALILRLQEMGGEQTDATVLLDEQIVGKPAEAVEVDLLERPVGEELAASATDGVTVSLPPKGIASIRVGLHDDSFKTVARGPAHE